MANEGEPIGDAYVAINADLSPLLQAMDDAQKELEERTQQMSLSTYEEMNKAFRTLATREGGAVFGGDSDSLTKSEYYIENLKNATKDVFDGGADSAMRMSTGIRQVSKTASTFSSILKGIEVGGVSGFRAVGLGAMKLAAMLNPLTVTLVGMSAALFAIYKIAEKQMITPLDEGAKEFGDSMRKLRKETEALNAAGLRGISNALSMSTLKAETLTKSYENAIEYAREFNQLEDKKAELDIAGQSGYNELLVQEQRRQALRDIAAEEEANAIRIGNTRTQLENELSAAVSARALTDGQAAKDVNNLKITGIQEALTQLDNEERKLGSILDLKKQELEVEEKIYNIREERAQFLENMGLSMTLQRTKLSGMSEDTSADKFRKQMEIAAFDWRKGMEDLGQSDATGEEYKLKQQTLTEEYLNEIKGINKSAEEQIKQLNKAEAGFTSLEGWWQQMQKSAIEGEENKVQSDQLTALEEIVTNTNDLKGLSDKLTSVTIFGDAD